MRRPAVGAAGGPRTDGGASSSTQPPAANGTPGAVPRATAASPQLQLHPVTLAFSDARLEAEFTKHQADSQLAYDKGVHALHLVISLANCCYSAYAMTGSLVTPASIALTVPYQIVALLHWWLSRTRVYERHRLLLLLPLEAAYHAVCTVSMPHWVLAPATSWRHYLKIFSLGSGVLISAWWDCLAAELCASACLACVHVQACVRLRARMCVVCLRACVHVCMHVCIFQKEFTHAYTHFRACAVCCVWGYV